MTFEMGTLIAFILAVIGGAVGYGRLNRSVEGNSDEIKELWAWKNRHEKEATDNREHFNNQISEMRGSQLVSGEQFKQIVQMLTDYKEDLAEIKERMTKLENK